MLGKLGASIPMQRWKSPSPFSMTGLLNINSIEFTYVRWNNRHMVLLLWALWGAVITDKTTKIKIRILMWPTVAWLQQQQNWTMCHFFRIKQKFLDPSTLVYICLQSSSDSPTLVYTRLCFQNRSIKLYTFFFKNRKTVV